MPDIEEVIATEFETIVNLIRVSQMAEHSALVAGKLGEHLVEERYLNEADHALESARSLFILCHR